MPGKLPRITAKQAIRAIEAAGFVHVRTTGSHQHFKHPDRPGLVTIPAHVGEILYPALLRSILRQAGLSVDEFRELLK